MMSVVFVIIILQLPEFLGILAGVLVQAGVLRKLPSSFICLKALEVSELKFVKENCVDHFNRKTQQHKYSSFITLLLL